MGRYILIGIASVALVAGFVAAWSQAGEEPGAKAAVGEKAADRDSKLLQGDWAVVGMETDGKKLPPEAIDAMKGGRWSFNGSEVQFADPGEKLGGTTSVVLDSSKTPKHIDLVVLEGPKKGQTTQGIYKVEKDRLVICLRLGGKGRPKTFRTAPESSLVMMTFERVKKDAIAAADEFTGIVSKFENDKITVAKLVPRKSPGNAPELTVLTVDGKCKFMKANYIEAAAKYEVDGELAGGKDAFAKEVKNIADEKETGIGGVFTRIITTGEGDKTKVTEIRVIEFPKK